MPCPHFDVKIIQRSKRQSAVASAAYQSGERLFSEYDQKQKYYSHKSEIVHTEIMLPPHAPPEYADRNTLWNAAEAIEKQWNSQLARRFVLAIPRELSPEQYADLIRDYCREFFVSKGMIADFAIHDKGDGNPHAHILLTMRAMDEQGKWLPKSRKVYDLDENGERIRLASGRWKSHKEDTVDWNDQKYAEIWRQGWADTANRYEWVWYKSRCTGFLNARRAPLKKTENILVFYQKSPAYFPQFEQGKPYKKIHRCSGNSPNYGKFERTSGESDGRRFPGNVLAFPTVTTTVHPTQKPVALCEYLIRTYTRPGEVVADICAGSGTTAVAALNTGRRFVCFETAPAFYGPATERIRRAREAVASGGKGE